MESQARELIRETGHRVTRPRLETLSTLMLSDQALSHGDLRARMPDMDRVSLYRSLEWLVEHNLIFRIDTDGQHRYHADPHEHQGHQHPHFCCTACGLTTCLDEARPATIHVPRGFTITEIELLVKGLCRSCASDRTA